MATNLIRRLLAFAGSRTANVAIITSLTALPVVAVAGVAIDYAVQVAAKSKLDVAADAAAVAAITKAKVVISGGASTSAGIQQGQAQGQLAFKANAGLPSFLTNDTVPTPLINIVPNGQVLTATVSYSTTTRSQFGNFFNISSNRISGVSATSTVLNPYYQFIFLVDISGSMSIGGTTSDINGLIADQRIGCAFACHDPYNNRGPNYRAYAKADGWTLKIDYVNSAIQNFISDLKTQTQSLSGVYSIGIDTFASSFNTLLAPSANNFSAAQSAASSIDIENMLPYSVATQGYTTTTSSLLSTLAQLTNVGDGTAVNKQKTYVIFLTDGIEDIQGNMMYSRGTDVTYTSACRTIMNNPNITLISIAAPYPAIPNDSQYATLIAPWETAPAANAMAACASSSNWAFSATNGPAINTAVQTVLSQIIQGMTRLTQ